MKIMSLLAIALLFPLTVLGSCDEFVMKSSQKDESNMSFKELKRRSITRSEFCEILTEFDQIFKKEVKKKLKTDFQVEGYWASEYPQASAKQNPDPWETLRPKMYSIAVNGAVVNDYIKNKNELRILLCHELGHIMLNRIYGISKNKKSMHAKPEGYADFFATNYCIKRLNGLAKLNLRLEEISDALFGFALNNGLANGEAPFLKSEFDYSVANKLITEHADSKCRYSTLLVGLEHEQLNKSEMTKILPRCWYKLE